MQFEERIEVEPVRRTHELEVLSFQRWGSVVVRGQPRCGVHDVFHTDEPAGIADRLIDQRFRILHLKLAIADQRAIDVVNAHGSMVWPTYAAKRGSVAGRAGIVDVDELPRRL